MRTFLIFIVATICAATAFTQSATKVDEFVNIPCDDYLGRMDAAMMQAHENPEAKMVVILYIGRERIYSNRTRKMQLAFPAVNTAAIKLESMKRYVEVVRRFPHGRFSFVDGGLREEMSVEIWLVPRGADTPKPTPTLNRIRYRKGTARGFCIDCCGN